MMNIMEVQPHQDVRHLLRHRGPDECYLLADQGRVYAVYFPIGGRVRLDISAVEDSSYVRWLKTDTSKWADDWGKVESVADGIIELDAPGKHWVAVIASQPLE